MKKRVISAIIALAIAIPVFIIGGLPWKFAFCLISALGLKEIIELKESHEKLPLYVIICAYALLILIVLNIGINDATGINYVIIALSALVLLTPTIFDKRYETKDGLYLFGSVFMLGLFFNLMNHIYFAIGKWTILYLFLCAVMTDTFAMIVGCLIGKHKLIPEVSPKKSVEGSIAGSLVGTIVCSIIYYNLIYQVKSIILIIIMTLILTIMGQIGDLFFSKMKRENKIKDFSNIMPGHGGVLDRLDSLSFIVFTYMVITFIISRLF